MLIVFLVEVMKVYSQLLAVLGSVAIAGGLGSVIMLGRSQGVPLAEAMQPPVIEHPVMLAQTTNNPGSPDLLLLVKTSANFLAGERYQTESNMQIIGTAPGSNVVLNIQIKTTVQAPKQFRAELTFPQPDGTRSLTGVIVSDGELVWLYRPDLEQYTTLPYEKFDQSDDSFLIGMSSSLFLQIPAETRKQIAQGNLEANTNVLKELGLPPSLKGGQRTINGQKLYGYEYTDEKEGYLFRAVVEPTTATLQQLQISGKAESLDIVITEQILKRTANPEVTANMFRLTPPANAKYVDQLSIIPF
jgi:outer membrane lipoprotein-sorting protein